MRDTQHLTPIAEGKTKIIWPDPYNPKVVTVESKDDITAGNGARHDTLAGKARWSTTTTSHVFAYLKRHQFPVAFERQIDATRFRAIRCDMLPFEVVIRHEAHGSYCRRNPHVAVGTPLGTETKPLCEFYLKTNNRRWGDYTLPCDDPLMRFGRIRVDLMDPDDPHHRVFTTLAEGEIYNDATVMNELYVLADLARSAFIILRSKWAQFGLSLVDYKVEFGIGPDGRIYFADVIDNDSWRLLRDGRYLDKEGYRQDEALPTVSANFAEVAQLSERFTH